MYYSFTEYEEIASEFFEIVYMLNSIDEIITDFTIDNKTITIYFDNIPKVILMDNIYIVYDIVKALYKHDINILGVYYNAIKLYFMDTKCKI